MGSLNIRVILIRGVDAQRLGVVLCATDREPDPQATINKNISLIICQFLFLIALVNHGERGGQ